MGIRGSCQCEREVEFYYFAIFLKLDSGTGAVILCFHDRNVVKNLFNADIRLVTRPTTQEFSAENSENIIVGVFVAHGDQFLLVKRWRGTDESLGKLVGLKTALYFGGESWLGAEEQIQFIK